MLSDVSLQVVDQRPQVAAANLIHGLDFIWLEITNRCNLQCSHCYANSGPHEPESHGMQVADWLQLLNDAHALGCRKVQFIGGEPLLYPGLPDLIRRARNLNYEIIEVYTNATRLSDDVARLFRENGVMLATSFYSDDDCTHDAMTGVRGSQKRTIKGLERAVAAGIPIRVGIVATEEQRAATNRTIEFLRGIGIDQIRVDHIRGVGRGSVKRECEDPKNELCGACWRGRLAVNSAGDVSPCVFSHFNNVGHASQGLTNILKSRALQDFRDEVRQIEAVRSAFCNPDMCHPIPCNPQMCNPNECNPIQCNPA